MKKKIIIGYTSGVFDLFHVGHVKVLKKAKSLCDKLIVGVSTDRVVKKYKNKYPIIKYKERVEIIKSIKYVDYVVPQNSLNKFDNWKKLKYDLMFVGDDWFATKVELLDKQFKSLGIKIVYLPYTKGTSSTKINSILDKFGKMRTDKTRIRTLDELKSREKILEITNILERNNIPFFLQAGTVLGAQREILH